MVTLKMYLVKTGLLEADAVYVQNGLKLTRNTYQCKIDHYFHMLKMTKMNMFLNFKIFIITTYVYSFK